MPSIENHESRNETASDDDDADPKATEKADLAHRLELKSGAAADFKTRTGSVIWAREYEQSDDDPK